MKIIRKLAIWITILLIAGNIGYRLGSKNTDVSFSQEKKLLVNTSTPESRDIDFSLFWDVWGRLEKQYVDKSKIDPEKMVYGAISGMVSAIGDPYTVFLPPKENEDFKQDLNGSFEGIGAQLGSKEDRIVVIAPLKDHPAEKAGMKAGDWIIKVNDEETFGWSVPQAVNKIRGPKGTSVKLAVAREGVNEPIELTITRDTIIVKSVAFETKSSQKPECVTPGVVERSVNCHSVAYIRLSRFGDQTNDEWNQAVAEIRALLSENKVKGIILDVRNNPGGYLQSAIYIASEFIKNGVVVKQENSDETVETYSVSRVGNLLEVPLVVLINQGSASASEILSGALRDHDRAQLVGETSFGKGSIQTPEDLPGGSGIHITTARWLLPKGDQINEKGIKPQFEVKSATDAAALDPQFEKAYELLTASK
ncbi:MAG: Carboxyl-terminal protease [Candidatus Gottesmanbacteria bacterium GW2011_GWA1_43_11]|uniref:Carboxyl-terminal protease n=1 Tax=Candidatus Gottesmanbacteria bacterium GW2011_GWA1_43_11 TaxID=1618436 RepID=A0A0G1CIN8_9BACT|nr:MAG: Carboxyl-terminal protease [Candidatus Gottesmanbacteria bacterium GW2011_GWA1_43_11]